MSALRFVVPLPLNIANARLHWAKKHRARKDYFAQLDTMQAGTMLPAPPARPFASALVASSMYVKRRMDTDNAMARHKWILDWLETRGYIVNDRDLEWTGVPTQTSGCAETFIALTLTPK